MPIEFFPSQVYRPRPPGPAVTRDANGSALGQVRPTRIVGIPVTGTRNGWHTGGTGIGYFILKRYTGILISSFAAAKTADPRHLDR